MVSLANVPHSPSYQEEGTLEGDKQLEMIEVLCLKCVSSVFQYTAAVYAEAIHVEMPDINLLNESFVLLLMLNVEQ